MPFYVSPEQAMRDKADYARRGIARGRSCVTLQYAGGILMVTPNASSALHKISELYDRIAFAAVGRFTEYEALRKAGVTYADLTGYQFDRADVSVRSIANYYAQNLDQIFTQSLKPYEVEIVVAEVGTRPDNDQIYRITYDGSVSDEPGFVAFGGQADQVADVLKERFSDGMSLTEALAAALAALAAPSSGSSGSSGSSSSGSGNGQPAELTASELEVAILDRARAHRTFRRLRGARLEELLAESREASSSSSSSESDSGSSGSGSGSGSSKPGSSGSSGSSSRPSGSGSSGGEPPTGPSAPGGDGIPKPGK
ncbi:MAG TPA: proteasome subunit alpha [Trebonia sp.]